jgi:hypothetical protein
LRLKNKTTRGTKMTIQTKREIRVRHEDLRKRQILRAFGHSRMGFELGFSWQNYQKPVTVDDVANNLARECPTAVAPGSDEARALAQGLIDEAVGKKCYFKDNAFMPLGSLLVPFLWPETSYRHPHLVELAEDPARTGVKRYQLRYECVDHDD